MLENGMIVSGDRMMAGFDFGQLKGRVGRRWERIKAPTGSICGLQALDGGRFVSVGT